MTLKMFDEAAAFEAFRETVQKHSASPSLLAFVNQDNSLADILKTDTAAFEELLSNEVAMAELDDKLKSIDGYDLAVEGFLQLIDGPTVSAIVASIALIAFSMPFAGAVAASLAIGGSMILLSNDYVASSYTAKQMDDIVSDMKEMPGLMQAIANLPPAKTADELKSYIAKVNAACQKMKTTDVHVTDKGAVKKGEALTTSSASVAKLGFKDNDLSRLVKEFAVLGRNTKPKVEGIAKTTVSNVKQTAKAAKAEGIDKETRKIMIRSGAIKVAVIKSTIKCMAVHAKRADKSLRSIRRAYGDARGDK